MPAMPEAPQVDDPRPGAGPIAAWRRSSDLRFYATSLIVAADIILVVSMVRAREEPAVIPPRRRPTEGVYVDGAPRPVSQMTASTPDPFTGTLNLARALDGVTGDGAPVATIETSRGTLRCALWSDHARRAAWRSSSASRGACAPSTGTAARGSGPARPSTTAR